MMIVPFLKDALKKTRGEGTIKVSGESFLMSFSVPLTVIGLRQVSEEVQRAIDENYRGEKRPRVYSVVLEVDGAIKLQTSVTKHPVMSTTDDVLGAAHTAISRMTDSADKAMGASFDRAMAVCTMLEGLLKTLTGSHASEMAAKDQRIADLTASVVKLSDERIEYTKIVARDHLNSELEKTSIQKELAIIEAIKETGGAVSQFLPLVIKWALKGKLDTADLLKAAAGKHGAPKSGPGVELAELRKAAADLSDDEVKALLKCAITLDTNGKLLDCLTDSNRTKIGALLVSYGTSA